MKKILIITIAILMVGAIATAAGLGFRAQGIKQAQVGSGRCEAFVDENGDGICDSYALRPQPQDGTGKRWAAGRISGGFKGNRAANRGTGLAGQENFVDENGDGICDSYALRPQPQDGTGKRWTAGRIGGGFKGNRAANRGTGLAGQENFVDENGDGICDLLGTRNGMGRGKAFGRK